MRIEGRNIYLQEISEEHTPLIVRWRNNPQVWKNFIFQEPFTAEMHERWLRERVRTGEVVQFIIYESADDQPVGSVYLRDVDKKNEKAEFGIFIGEDNKRGRGYGSEAAELLCGYGFDEMCLHKIMLRVYAGNQAAVRSYQKAGFVQEAYLKDEIKNSDGFQDIILMARLKDNEEK